MVFRSQKIFYYSGGQKQDLNLSTEYLAVSPAKGKLDALKRFLESSGWTKKPLEMNATLNDVYLVSLDGNVTSSDIYGFIERLNGSGTVRFSTPVFDVPNGIYILTDEFVVKFKPGIDAREIERFIDENRVETVRKDYPLPGWYKLRFTSRSGANTFDVANRFYQSKLVEYAHPDFIEQLNPLWETIYSEDFESDVPNLWEAWDSNPVSGEYYWGRISSLDYPSAIDDYTTGEYKCWVSAAHDIDSPDRHPDDDVEEKYAPNMDAWIKFGPFDFSNLYWAYLNYALEYSVARSDGPMSGYISFDNGNSWNELHNFISYRGIIPLTYLIQNIHSSEVNQTGSQEILLALRFVSDNSMSGNSIDDRNESFMGIYIDDVSLLKSNTQPAPAITTDPYSARQWNLHNVGQSGGEEGWDINIVPAWEYLQNSLQIESTDFSVSDIVVAVIDTGVDLEHEDLNTVAGYDAVYASGEVTDVNDSHGAPVYPVEGHGTACAGIIGAKHNGVGVVGAAPGVKIMPVRIFRLNHTTLTISADGLRWAVDHGAKILSNSWSGGIDSDVRHEALRYAKEKSVIAIFSSGNDDTSAVNYPAKYEETIAVGAMSPCGERKNRESCDREWWWGSDYGPELDVVAPGAMIPTTDMSEGGYAWNDLLGLSRKYFLSFNGTSSAAPHVAGVAALLLSINPDLTPEEVRTILHRTARDLNVSGRDDETGYGLVDAFAAVSSNMFMTDLKALSLSFEGTLFPGASLDGNLTLSNSSRKVVPPFMAALYLSKDNIVDGNDSLLWEETIGTMPMNSEIKIDLAFALPEDVESGHYMLIAVADSNDTVVERNETDNFLYRLIDVVNPPHIVLKDEQIDFGIVVVGSSGQRTLEIKNEFDGKAADLHVTEIAYIGPAVFSLDLQNPPTESDPIVFANHQSMDIPLYFSPQSEGNFSGTVRIRSDDPDEPVKEVNLSGSAVEGVPVISISGDTIFQPDETSKILTIENRGNAPLQWSIGPDEYQQLPWPAWLAADPMSGTTEANETSQVTLTVDRSGLDKNSSSYSIYVNSNDPNNASVPVLIVLKVGSVKPELDLNTTTLDFGATEDTMQFTLSNTGEGNLTWQIEPLPEWLNAAPQSGTVEAGSDRRVTVSVDRNRPAGDYAHTMQITSNGGNAEINVSMQVLPALQITPKNVVLDQCGAEQQFAVQGGTPPYQFTLKAAADERVPENAGLFDVDALNGRAMVRIDPCNISDTTAFTAVESDLPIRNLNVSVGDVTVETLDPSDLEDHSVSSDMAVECGGTQLILEVKDKDGRMAFATMALDGRSWVRAYGGEYDDTIFSVEPDADGIVISGVTKSYGAGTPGVTGDMWVLKLYGYGKVAWQKTYGTPASESIAETIPTSDGGYLVAGSSIKAYQAGVWILKLDGEGSVVWHRVFRGSYFNPTAVAEKDSYYYITAGSDSDDQEMVLLKLDEDGHSVWKNGSNDNAMKLFSIEGTDNYDAGDFVVLPSNELVIVGGATFPLSQPNQYQSDLIVIKTDENGTVLWSKAIGKSQADENGVQVTYHESGSRIVRNGDGSFTILGTLSMTAAMEGGGEGYSSSHAILMVRLDENGTIVWQKTISGIGGGWQPSISPADDGGYVIAGYVEADSDDYWLAKADSDGNLLWQYRFDSNGHTDQSHAVSVMPDGDIVLSGGGWKYIFGSDTDNDSANGWTLR
ncbi:S8 family serine peptidase, partial [Hydrogenimonas sp.]|uniref:S8 family serine peptidase n=1 Tax=Hydrogenimonas sp. TaxID=2231112 RepID=UPI0026262148